MAADKPAGMLAKYGAALIDAGYSIVPIKQGEKFPPFNDWQDVQADHGLLKKWLSGSFPAKRGSPPKDFTYTGGPRDGVGILTADTPAVDLDIKDPALVQEMIEFVSLLIGDAPTRIGDAPKTLLLFRTDEPFRKVQSSFWLDEDGRKHKVEILGEGQQFVAVHIHPDTKKPYRWVSKANPINTPVADLRVIREQDASAIVAEFERLAEARGWTRQAGSGLARKGPRIVADEGNPFAHDAPKTVISDDELHQRLLLTPGAEDYETWVQVGMALYHQYDGDEHGLNLWHEWSSTADNYDKAALDEKWGTFDDDGKGFKPVTARLILKLSKEHQEKLQTETLAEVESRLKEVDSRNGLKAICDEIKHLELDALSRESLIGLIQKRFKAIVGQPLRIGVARDMIRFENPEQKSLPHWLEGWVYCSHPETFFNRFTYQEVTRSAFNDIHGRYLLTKKDVLEGKSTPEAIASHVALHLYQIETVENRMYLPGEDPIFAINRRKYVNSYDDRNVPEAPDKISERDRRNVEIVVNHATHLFEVERDRELFLDFLSHVIQGGPRIDWAVLLQGTEGDGKSFFARLLSAMLGWENVKSVAAQALEEKFTPWAEGAQVIFFEEIKLHGHNRFDVLNKLKPFITNQVMDVRRMNVDRYQAINTGNYILTTNFKDALPLDKNDSRYLVLFSRFQSKDALAEFMARDPSYYQRLHDALDESRGAIRRWFLDRVQSPEFNHTGRAPESTARKEMVSYAMSSEQEVLQEILDESPRLDLSSTLLDSGALSDEMAGRDCDPPYGKAMARLLLDAGFTRLGKVRIGKEVRLFWSRSPQRFRDGFTGDVSPKKVKEWLDPGL